MSNQAKRRLFGRVVVGSSISAFLASCGSEAGSSEEQAMDNPDAEVKRWRPRPPAPAPAPAPTPAPAPAPTPTPTPAPAPAPAGVVYSSVRTAALGHGASLNGAIPFPPDNAWNQNISSLPVDPNSANLIASIGISAGLHPDFGSGTWNGAPIGIPYVVVAGTQPRVNIRFTAYGSESDPGPYPIPADARIEGAASQTSPDNGGDRHVIVIDRDNNRLYELYRAFRNSDGSWNADSAAVFHLDSNIVRPTARAGWTSADAAGLPIFPGLVRYDEVAAGVIRHALRFTVQRTRRAYVPPATHFASNSTDSNYPPMDMRVRLKASYQIPSTFNAHTRVILQAMKTYGMLLADNGSNWYVTGVPDSRWSSRLTSELSQVRGSNFEVVRMSGLVTG
jgi:hypothetical protein